MLRPTVALTIVPLVLGLAYHLALGHRDDYLGHFFWRIWGNSRRRHAGPSGNSTESIRQVVAYGRPCWNLVLHWDRRHSGSNAVSNRQVGRSRFLQSKSGSGAGRIVFASSVARGSAERSTSRAYGSMGRNDADRRVLLCLSLIAAREEHSHKATDRGGASCADLRPIGDRSVLSPRSY